VRHLQQILNAYGSDGRFHWCGRPSDATRVVTVHELDLEQLAYRDRNRIYTAPTRSSSMTRAEAGVEAACTYRPN